jgi:hypothetical protein
MISALKAVIDALKALRQFKNDQKAKQREKGIWDVLKTLQPSHHITAEGIFKQFDWQVSGPLFDDVSEVEEVLRSMWKGGIVEYYAAIKSWRITASRPGRFPAPW